MDVKSSPRNVRRGQFQTALNALLSNCFPSSLIWEARSLAARLVPWDRCAVWRYFRTELSVRKSSTYVVDDGDTIGSVCIYQATSGEALRKHAARVGIPADEITLVADTVVIRPDPEPTPAST